MKYIRIFFWCGVLFLHLSCSGKKEESWEVNRFDKKQIFSLAAPKNKTVNNANIYVTGKFSGQVKMQRSEGYPIVEFSSDSIPERFFYDFYGGDFQIILLPSSAKGKIELTIEIPYSN
jgi:hypothetical protein